MNKEELEKVEQLIEQKDSEQLKDLLAGLHTADIAELCNELDAEEARFIYLLLDNETAADVLIEMDEDARKEFLEILPSETIHRQCLRHISTNRQCLRLVLCLQCVRGLLLVCPRPFHG